MGLRGAITITIHNLFDDVVELFTDSVTPKRYANDMQVNAIRSIVLFFETIYMNGHFYGNYTSHLVNVIKFILEGVNDFD